MMKELLEELRALLSLPGSSEICWKYGCRGCSGCFWCFNDAEVSDFVLAFGGMGVGKFCWCVGVETILLASGL